MFAKLRGYFSSASASSAVSVQASGDGFESQSLFAKAKRFFSPGIRDAKTDTLKDLKLSRAQSRSLARNSPIAVGAINTNVTRVVGTGLALSVAPNIKVLGWTEEQGREFKELVQVYWSMFADSKECDVTGIQNFYELQALVYRSVLESGDCFTLLPTMPQKSTFPFDLRLQVVEADRIGSPSPYTYNDVFESGIKTDRYGKPVACYIYDEHPGAATHTAMNFNGSWVDFESNSGRKKVVHHFQRLRPEAPRGTPYLTPIIGLIKEISRYSEAEVTAAVVSALFTVFIEGPAGGDTAPIFAGQEQAGESGEIKLGAGAVVGLAPGEKVSTFNPNRPNVNMDAFISGMMKQVGMALNVPAEILMKKFEASYSASKAAFLDAYLVFRCTRVWLAKSFCEPVYETWLAEMVANGHIDAPGFFTDPMKRWAYSRSAWHGDSMGSINPKDEIQAYVMAINAKLLTNERAEWELFGTDWHETLGQKVTESKLQKENDLVPAPVAGAAVTPKQDNNNAKNN